MKSSSRNRFFDCLSSTASTPNTLHNDSLLTHVYIGDVARFAVAESGSEKSQSSLKTLMDHLESGLRSGSDEVRELILASFVENLMGEPRAVMKLKLLTGPRLKAA